MDITNIIEALLALVAAIVTTILIPKLKAWIDNKNATVTWENCVVIVRTLVCAAEQIYRSTDDEKLGEERKAYVMAMLEKMNLTLDLDVLDAMVEDEVRKLNEQLGAGA